jgi:hypothetical protein
MRTASLRLLGASLVLALLMALAGCGKGKSGAAAVSSGGPAAKVAPVAPEGTVSVATRNTTRVGGSDPVADAAAVARLVYPGLTPATRPRAVVLVDEKNWTAALVASALASAPLGAPVLYSEGNVLPAVSRETLEAMHPLGEPALGGARVIRVGNSAPLPQGWLSRTVPGAEPAVQAAAVAQLLGAAAGSAPREVIVLGAGVPAAIQMPAAGLAAESGAPIVFVTPAGLPPASAALLSSLKRPSMYVLGAPALGSHTLGQLGRFGRVTAIPATGTPVERESAVANAISLARFTDGVFGWGIKEPGHGLVFANEARPLDAPASALLSATGDYGPLLLLASADQIPPELATYLADIQPAYTLAPQFRPVRGVYNHGWVIGDEAAISAVTQAELDARLEISPRKPSSEEPSLSPAE